MPDKKEKLPKAGYNLKVAKRQPKAKCCKMLANKQRKKIKTEPVAEAEFKENNEGTEEILI